MRHYRFIVVITSILLAYSFVIHQTNQKSNSLPLTGTENKISLNESELITRYLTNPYITAKTELYYPVPDSRICFISASKSELWKGLVKSHTYFTNLFLRKISIYHTETDLLFSNKTLLTISKILQDEPLFFLRI